MKLKKAEIARAKSALWVKKELLSLVRHSIENSIRRWYSFLKNE